MRRLIPLFVFALMPMLATADPIPVYVLLGQSNCLGYGANSGIPSGVLPLSGMIYAEGDMAASKSGQWLAAGGGFGKDVSSFGPEVGFLNAHPGAFVIKFTKAATSMATYWRSPSSGMTGDGYTRTLQTIQAAWSALPANANGYQLAGVLWYQGEADAQSRANAVPYRQRLAAFIMDLRADLNAPDLPFIICRITACEDCDRVAIVQQGQEHLASEVNHVYTFSTGELGATLDGTHQGSANLIEIGRRFAWRFVSPAGWPVSPSP